MIFYFVFRRRVYKLVSYLFTLPRRLLYTYLFGFISLTSMVGNASSSNLQSLLSTASVTVRGTTCPFLAKLKSSLRLDNGIANLSVVCDVRAPYSGGLTFRGFLHHIIAWPSGNSPTKNHEDRPRGSPPTGVLNARG